MMHFVYSFITFLIALFFLSLGVVVLLMQVSSTIYTDVIEWIKQDTLFLPLFGFISVLIGSAIIFYLFNFLKKATYKIRSSKGSISVDESVFRGYMKNYWEKLFPQMEISHNVLLKNNKVEILANLPFVAEDEQKELLNRIEKDLKEIFDNLLGYKKEYLISISFQQKK